MSQSQQASDNARAVQTQFRAVEAWILLMQLQKHHQQFCKPCKQHTADLTVQHMQASVCQSCLQRKKEKKGQ